MWVIVWFVALFLLVAWTVATEKSEPGSVLARHEWLTLVLYAAWGAFFLLSGMGWSRSS